MKTKLCKLVGVLLSLTLCVGLLTGIGSSAAAESSQGGVDISQEVELVMHVVGQETPGVTKMLEKLNEWTKRDLNCTVKVTWIGFGELGQKYPLVLSSGESVDTIFVAGWLSFPDFAAKGAFLPIEDLIETYAPESYKQMDWGAFEYMGLDGHVYAIPQQNPNYNMSIFGPVYRGDLIEKYEMPIDEIKTFDDYVTYMEIVMENGEFEMATAMSQGGPLDFIGLYMRNQGQYYISGNRDYWVDLNDPEYKVYNIADWEGMPDLLGKMKEWGDKGFWTKSALSDKDDAQMDGGRSASWVQGINAWAGLVMGHPEWDARYVNLNDPLTAPPYSDSGMAIPTTAKNPERALMLIDKLATDEDYYKLFAYGTEGEDYTLAEGQIIPNDTNNFPLSNGMWGWENPAFSFPFYGMPENFESMRDGYMNSAVENPFAGFVLNTEPVKLEYTSIGNVITQYFYPVSLGYTDPVTGLSDTQAQMKLAGNEAIVAEFQQQVDAFIASQTN